MNQQQLLAALVRFQGAWLPYSAGTIADTAEVLSNKHRGNIPANIVADTLRRYTPPSKRMEVEAFIAGGMA